MPQIAYRGNLSAATYPMTIAEAGRSVVIPGPDNNFDRRVDPQGEQSDAGIPQAIYLENVLPTTNGYQSVGYLSPTVPMVVPSGAVDIVRTFSSWSSPTTLTGTPARWQSGVVTKISLFFWNNGKVTSGTFGEIEVSVFDGAGLPTVFSYNSDILFDLFSTANVAGVCYLFHNEKLYTVEHAYDNAVPPAVVIRDVTATVLPALFCQNKVAIVGSSNYLIFLDTTTVYWSSTTTPTDFQSSLVTGAGQIDPNNTDGAMWYAVDSREGFYILSSNNTIQAKYTGNARYPWKFVVIKGSQGLSYPREQLVFGSTDSNYTVVFESDKQIKLYSDTTGSDFLVALNNYFKNTVRADLDYSTNLFSEQYVRTDFAPVFIYANRYILVSVDNRIGDAPTLAQYTGVIVIDLQTSRIGRLKIDHDYILTVDKSINTATGYIEPLLCFVNVVDNTLKYLNLDIYNKQVYTSCEYDTMQGAILLGKFQHVRSRMVQIEEVELEGPQNKAIISSPNFSAVLLPSLDGRNFDTPVPLTPSYQSGGLVSYNAHSVGKNVSLLVKGAFSLNTLQLRYQIRGDK